MLQLLAALALTAQDVPAPPLLPVPEVPAPGEGPSTTIVEIHKINPSDANSTPASPRPARTVNCEGQRFEFTAASGDDPTKQHKSRIVLCSDKGASREKVVAMLEDAARRLEAGHQLPAANRDKIVSEIRSKVGDLKSGN